MQTRYSLVRTISFHSEFLRTFYVNFVRGSGKKKVEKTAVLLRLVATSSVKRFKTFVYIARTIYFHFARLKENFRMTSKSSKDGKNEASNEKDKKRHRKKKFYNEIRLQLEFYFGDANLAKDRFTRELIEKDPCK